jgi:hypothetical protein
MKPFIFLVMISLSILLFAKKMDSLLGSHNNCFICTKLNYNGYLTNWSISHFVAFAISGYLCPNNPYLLIFIGILWEIVEFVLEYNAKLNQDGFLCKRIMTNCNKESITKKEFWDHYLGYHNHELILFWCSGGLVGSLSDIVINTLGIYTGRYLARR